MTAQNTLGSLQETAQVQLAKLGGNLTLPIESLPQYKAAQAAVDEQQRQLDHSVVRAPFDGTVTEVDSLQPGTLVISACRPSPPPARSASCPTTMSGSKPT